MGHSFGQVVVVDLHCTNGLIGYHQGFSTTNSGSLII